MSRDRLVKTIAGALLLAIGTISANTAFGEDVSDTIRKAGISGGLIVQVGAMDVSLQSLGDRFHVRYLLPNDEATGKAQSTIDRAGLQGRFTATTWNGGHLPFADRVVNALLLTEQAAVPGEEARRVLTPGGLRISPEGAQEMPIPESIDEWTHFLYDASGNAVSKDEEIGPPRSFRWHAPPLHQRSHDWGSSFLGLVAANGRIYHLFDESPPLFSEGGVPERWSLIARDAFNGALLWKRPLEGYDYSLFESSGHQKIWRAPLSLNRRTVAQGDKLFTVLSYRDGPLSILDGATGETLREIDLGGSVDEIIAAGGVIVCRVRDRIPMEDEAPAMDRKTLFDKRNKEAANAAKIELGWQTIDFLKQQKERIVAVDDETGKILWERPGPALANEALAMADDIVVYHNYEALIALDAKSGTELWRHPTPFKEGSRFGIHNFLGDLMIADGKVVWTCNQTGGIGLDLADGNELWTNPRATTSGGFQFPTAKRVIRGVLYSDSGPVLNVATGASVKAEYDIGDMLRRGHHIRCFPGKATERYLITPHRGAEFVDLVGDDHMINDWVRGACTHGNLPANGLFYVTPDPCVCYAGAKIIGFQALAASLPAGLDSASAPDDPVRLQKGPAYGRVSVTPDSDAWASYRSGGERLNRSPSPLPAALEIAWTAELGGDLTQASIAAGRCYLASKDRYRLFCLDMKDGSIVWHRAFAAALDGPPTIVGEGLFLGCRSGDVYALNASDGSSVWTYRAAPLERLTLSDDRLENIWPVNGSPLYQNGLIYVLAGRNSHLDGGLRLAALDPATGAVKHYCIFDGPRPTKEQLRTGVINPPRNEKQMTPELKKTLQEQYATGYSVPGAEADVLVGDGKDIYLTQNKWTADLKPVPLKREAAIGITPMGGMHMMAQHGFADDSMFHRGYQQYDDRWMTKAGGSGGGARAGNMVAVGRAHAYAAKHFRHDWYPQRQPGEGSRVLRDPFDTENERGDKLTPEMGKELGFYNHASALVRTKRPDWEIELPIIVRSMLVAPGADGNEIVFAAGIVEGDNAAAWLRVFELKAPAELYVLQGSDGKVLARHDLPACPVFDGMSAADGNIVIPMVNGQVQCMRVDSNQR